MPSFGIQVYGRRKQGRPRPTDTCVLHLLAASTLPESCPAGLPPPCLLSFVLLSLLAFVLSSLASSQLPLLACLLPSIWPASTPIYWPTYFLSPTVLLLSSSARTIFSSPFCLALLPAPMARYSSTAASPAVLPKPACLYPFLPPCNPACLPSETPRRRPPSAGGAAGSKVLVVGVLARRRRSGGESGGAPMGSVGGSGGGEGARGMCWGGLVLPPPLFLPPRIL